MMLEFRELKVKYENLGLFETNWFWQLCKLTIPYTLLLFGFYLLWINHGLKDFRLSLIATLCLAFATQQGSFIGHDTLHQSVVRNNRDLNFTISCCWGTFLFGISSIWWNYTHNQHHVVTNEYDHDPDITHLPFFAVNKMMFLSEKKGKTVGFFGRVLICLQFITMLPILIIIARISMTFHVFFMHFSGYVLTMNWQNVHVSMKHRILDFLMTSLHLVWVITAFYYIPTGHKLICYSIFHLIVGSLHLVLTVNHFERPTLHSSEETNNWLIKQVITGRNIEVTFLNEWFFGGLHHQIEHHLFPRMPRNNLSKIKPEIMQICKKYNIEYCSTGFFKSVYDVLMHLKDVSQYSFDSTIKD